MFLYARIYWLTEFGDVSCLQFNYLRVETLTLTPTCEDFVGRFCRTILRVTLSSSPTKLCVQPESMIVDTLGGICKHVCTGNENSKPIWNKFIIRKDIIETSQVVLNFCWTVYKKNFLFLFFSFFSISCMLFEAFFSSPGPKVQVNYCHHLASVVCRL